VAWGVVELAARNDCKRTGRAQTRPAGLSLVQLGELRAFQRQVVHQAFLAEDETDHYKPAWLERMCINLSRRASDFKNISDFKFALSLRDDSGDSSTCLRI
jgi:hypothetical protein